jgi:DNA-binding NtrC family response regulator
MNGPPAAIRVLIVDDEKEYVDALVERLGLRGVDVAGTLSGEDALRLLESKPMDVVVLDVLMPGLGGLKTLVEIKERFPETAVIMLSGHADIDTAILGMELGAFDYLVKPTGLDDLLYKIEDAHHSTD